MGKHTPPNMPDQGGGGELGLLLDYSFQGGVNLQDRTCLIQGDITDETFRYVHAFLSEMETAPKVPAKIYLNSPGGDLLAASSVISRIRQSEELYECKVDTRGYGLVASAAFLILAAGTGTREISAEASGMWHTLAYGSDGTLAEQKVTLNQTEYWMNFWTKWLAGKTFKTANFWEKTGNGGDKYFTAAKMLKMGVVDAIV